MIIVITILFTLLVADTKTHQLRKRQDFIDASSVCKNPDGRPGLCISIRQCQPLVTLLVTQRHQAQVTQYLRQSVCGYEGTDPKVCCPRQPDSDTQTVAPTTKPKTSATTTILPAPNVSGRTHRLPTAELCGNSTTKHTRVVGGVNATLGAWPWMAALGYQPTKGGTEPVFLCAGSLITNRHVLTAAHCLATNKKLLLVRLGDVNLYERSDGASPVDKRVAKTIPHENYNPATFTNDIALIILQSPVTFSENIKPICLPLSQELSTKDYVARTPFIAGWGSVSFAGPSSATLLELQIPVVPESECKRAFEPFKTAIIDQRVICAGVLRGGKDACRGDSGGPLMDYNNPDKLYYQIGVVSYGYKCAEPGFPGIYTRVTAFADWIVNQVEKTR